MGEHEIKILESSVVLLVIILLILFIYLGCMIYEVFRYLNYGKVSGEIGKELKECKWKKYYYVKTGVKKYACVRPGIIKKGDWTNCPPNCRHKRFAEMPKYEKTGILKFIEQMIAVIASLFAIYKICVEIYDRYMLLISNI